MRLCSILYFVRNLSELQEKYSYNYRNNLSEEDNMYVLHCMEFSMERMLSQFYSYASSLNRIGIVGPASLLKLKLVYPSYIPYLQWNKTNCFNADQLNGLLDLMDMYEHLNTLYQYIIKFVIYFVHIYSIAVIKINDLTLVYINCSELLRNFIYFNI